MNDNEKCRVVKAQQFANWRIALANERREQFCERVADNFAKMTTKRRCLLRWRGVLHQSYKSRIEKYSFLPQPFSPSLQIQNQLITVWVTFVKIVYLSKSTL